MADATTNAASTSSPASSPTLFERIVPPANKPVAGWHVSAVVDLVGEMGTVAKLHKVVAGDPTALPARRVLRMATMGSAAALHREREIGSLEVGKRADLILVSTADPGALPLLDPFSYLVYSAHAGCVQTVIVEGSIVMERRRIRTIDTDAIRRQALVFGRKIARAAGA